MDKVVHAAWRRAIVCIGAVLVTSALALVGINQTAIPRHLAETFTRIVAEQTGWQIELDGARLNGFTKLRLNDVVVRGHDPKHMGTLPVVDLSFNPLHWITRRGQEPVIGSIHLVRPRITAEAFLMQEGAQGDRSRVVGAAFGGKGAGLKDGAGALPFEVTVVDGLLEEVAADGETARLWRVDGRGELTSDGQVIQIDEIRLKQIGGGIEFSLAQEDEGGDPVYRWQAKGPSEFFLDLLDVDRWRITGAMQAEGAFALAGGRWDPGAIHRGRVTAKVTQGEIAWGDAAAREHAAFDTLEISAAGDEGTWRVDKLTIQKGAAFVRASGDLVRNPESSPAFELALAVEGTGLSFPEDIPILAKYGLSGRAEFSGALSGDLNDPELSGRLTIQEGTVWHRPVSRGEGRVLLTTDRFQFDETVLERGFSTYAISGEIVWADAPNRLKIELDASRGDVGELLRAFSIDADVEGRIDGKIEIQGPIGAIQLAGDARLSEVLIGDAKYFDQAQGRVAWADGVLTLGGVRAQSGGGEAYLDGTLSREHLALDVALDGWPLAAGTGPLVTLADGVQGWVSYRGRLVGDAASPSLRGELVDGELLLGRLSLSHPQGEMNVTLDRLELVDLSLIGAGEGRYRLQGAVDGWREATPTVDLDVQVEGASLAGLLQEGGLSLPALLLDGKVDGSLRLSGDARRPDATFDVALTDDLGVGDPIRLQFGVQDGRFKLSRDTVLRAIMNAS